eukprot:7898276-Pyramimonas_sp.AAC.1
MLKAKMQTEAFALTCTSEELKAALAIQSKQRDQLALQKVRYLPPAEIAPPPNMTSFYGSSCANNGKGALALNTPDTTASHCSHSSPI